MIDKNIPRQFVSDEDERLLQQGDMIEAQNVTISERGEGSDTILKTMKGHDSASPDTGVDPIATDVSIIGECSDPQRKVIYFFVSSNTGNDGDAIYQYSTVSNKYKEVFKSTWLNFDSASFVKADALNKSFQRDGQVQTILYFTDNDNPPRKINVDRALAGDYDGLSDAELDIALSTMRAAPTIPPQFRFETDTSTTDNNFEQNQFQFATQIVYTDGEVSALSPYSKLAISQASIFGGLEATDYGTYRNAQNVCVIKPNISVDHPDMKKIRILARSGNANSFFIVDEFDPAEGVTRFVSGSNQYVYTPESGEYSFYNDSLGNLVSSRESQKLYDNVPQKAQGQDIVGNRLVYSNYEEGYGNSPIGPQASITPVYSTGISGASSYTVPSDAALIFDYTAGDMNVSMTFTDGSLIDNSTEFPAGTIVTASFKFFPAFIATDTGGDSIIRMPVTQFNSDDQSAPSQEGYLEVDTLNLTNNISQPKTIQIIKRLPYDMSPNQLADYLQADIDEIEAIPFLFEVDSNVAATGSGVSSTTINYMKLRVWFKFGEDTSAAGNTVVFKPRITTVTLLEAWADNVGQTDFYFPSTYDVYQNPGNIQAEATFGTISSPASEEYISIDSVGASATFKSGATHAFGVVYYDKYGRSGFVNELGSTYVKTIPERPSTPGSVSMQFNLSSTALVPPSWADSYQIVYSGSSISDSFQYTVGGAYARRLEETEGADTNIVHKLDESTHNIYVSLATLDQYKRDKDVVRDYSFTKGDKLRILAHRNSADNAWVYNPLSSSGKVMEFDVVGLEYLDGTPIQKADTVSVSDAKNPYKGTFLVLSCPAVEASAGDIGNEEKYVGFDWYSITGENYNTSTTSSNSNYWNRRVLVEVFTPRKSTSEQIYYEIGERRRCGVYKDAGVPIGKHGPLFTVNGGDVHYRAVSCKAPTRQGGVWVDAHLEDPEDWRYTPIYVESPHVTDLYDSRNWDRGRAHAVFKDAANVSRYNGITYSDPYEDDTARLSISQFTPSDANFFDLPSEHGACTYIASVGDRLFALQENKCSIIGVNKGVLETGSQQGLVSISSRFLNNMAEVGGSYGTSNPESVLVRDGVVFFYDKQRLSMLKLSSAGLKNISDIDINSVFRNAAGLAAYGASNKVVCGYDPEDKILYVTFGPVPYIMPNGKTFGFNNSLEKWQGTYTFVPDIYSSQANLMYLGDQIEIGGDNIFIHRHGATTQSNDFYNVSEQRAESKVTVVANYNPSMVKMYKSISIEGDQAWTTKLESSSGQETNSLVFSKREDAFYADVTGDTSPTSNEHLSVIGEVHFVGTNTITLKNSLRGLHIPIGYTVYRLDSNGTPFSLTAPLITAVDRGGKTITLNGDVDEAVVVGDIILIGGNKSENGAQIRGHYCKIKCSKIPEGSNVCELFSINANFVNSKANHALGG